MAWLSTVARIILICRGHLARRTPSSGQISAWHSGERVHHVVSACHLLQRHQHLARVSLARWRLAFISAFQFEARALPPASSNRNRTALGRNCFTSMLTGRVLREVSSSFGAATALCGHEAMASRSANASACSGSLQPSSAFEIRPLRLPFRTIARLAVLPSSLLVSPLGAGQ